VLLEPDPRRSRRQLAAHLVRVTETAHWLEWQDWANPILKQPFVVKNGALEIPDVAHYRH
jgi:mandelate racemase